MTTPPQEPNELHLKWHLVLNAVRHDPARLLETMRAIEDESSPFVIRTIKARFGPAMKWGKRGRSIRRGADVLYRLSIAYSSARKLDRALLLENAVAELVACAVADNVRPIQSVADAVGKLILGGTPQQLFTTALAIRLGEAPELPQTLRDHLASALIEALTVILEVGAPAMRDAALEGLGSLLRHFKNRQFSLPSLNPTEMEEGDRKVNEAYNEWRRAREQIVLALSGNATELRRYEYDFRDSTNANYGRRALLTRSLPAMLRQKALSLEAVLICIREGAAVGDIGFDNGVKAQTDAARYQDSVFRTIAVLLDEPGVDANLFDSIVADAVKRIPETLLGPLELCNAQARATVTILCTAAGVAARLRGSRTDRALKQRYMSVNTEHTEWINPGIIEGCFRGLPSLLWDHTHDDWTTDLLKKLFTRMRSAPEVTDYVEMHARLCANASFRQILLALNERMHQQFLEFDQNVNENVRERAVEHAMRSLLENPTPDRVLAVFHDKQFEHFGDAPRNVSEVVVSAAALETTLLYRADVFFEEWSQLSDAQQLLLVRIMGCQLRAASRERVQIEQYPIVKRVLRRLSSVGIDDIDRDDMLWELLSRIPPRAAEAAESDLQDFVEYRTGYADAQSAGVHRDVDDLPGYVLAMVSDEVSDRLARDIARQVNLNLHRAGQQPDFNFADPLYQIMLRNPGPAIFNHLLAQIPERRYRDLLLLFRDHVIQVRDCMPRHPGDEVRIDGLVRHAESFSPKLRWHQHSPALRQLADAMRLYVDLASEKSGIWKAILGTHENDRDGGLGELFRALDKLDYDTQHRHEAAQPRTASRKLHRRRDSATPRKVMRRAQLAELCNEECVTLRLEIEHYLRLPVGKFDECRRALALAIAAVQSIRGKLSREGGLQPPEFVILDALLARWERIFDHTLQWYVDAPRRCVHARRKELFWLSFTNVPGSDLPSPDPVTESEVSYFHAAGDYTSKPRPQKTTALPDVPQPPIPPGQDVAFENFFVEWMASDLDVDHLRWALARRWGIVFRSIYAVITTLWRAILAIALPFVLLVLLHFTDNPGIEGIGFLAYIVLIVFFAVAAFVRRIIDESHPLAEGARPLFHFRFASLLPRLFRLIVVPLGLLIDFEHSYLFPMHASNSELVALLLLAFAAPHFFIRREVRSREGEISRLDDQEDLDDVRRRVRQILSVALSHSFMVALIFSFLFEAKYISRIHTADAVHQAAFSAKETAANSVTDQHQHYHHEPYFLGIIPREAHCDVTRVAHWMGYRILDPYAGWAYFEFYPTLILSWTALGLFFGVFLEGFLKGERLRGEIAS